MFVIYKYISEVIISAFSHLSNNWMIFGLGQVGWVSWTIKADGERHTDAKPRLSHWWSEPAAGLRSVTPLRAVWTSLRNVFSLFKWHWPF